ncbi:MAG TPA: outer membrane lipoprotein-sorting protein [Desulfobulbus sp.]|nr:outer membrane lipoprotein-sorting protein [Desulfobulbus sp.]
MKQMVVGLLALLVLLSSTPVRADKAAEIIRQVEENLNGRTAVMTMTMKVSTSRTQRSMTMESYSIGNEKSFIRILQPGKDKGITFLRIHNTMWQYVPRIEKTIKIPASMMLQSWMGSDFTNDDLVKESSLSKDYTTRMPAQTPDGYRLQLLPKDEAAVVWGEIVMEVSRKYLLPTRVLYFDEDGVLVRELFYGDVRAFGKRFYPATWVVIPKETDKAGHKTVITISRAVFDAPVNEAYFTKRALKRFSN